MDDAPAFARKVHATRYAPLEEWYAALRDDAAPPPETQRPRAAPQKDFYRNQAARALDKLRAAGVADVVLAHLLELGASGAAATRRGWGRCCWVTSKFVFICDSEYNYRRGRRMGMGGEVDGDVVHEDGERRAGVAFRRRGSGACAAAAWPCRA